jgi:pimeloyl-ACP methyl ester carboxylesterase
MTTATTPQTVASKDGTTIAFDRYGAGPAVILVTGALGTRAHDMDSPLATLLAADFPVYDYDRRGRGASGDTPPYAVQREVEDIEALIDAAGGSASLYGISSGAVLALEAASRLPGKVRKVALYEPPFIIDDSRPPVADDYVEQLDAAIAAGRRNDAVEIFMLKALLLPEAFLPMLRSPSRADDGSMQPPLWVAMEAVAHTLAYDGRVMGDTMRGNPLPTDRWSAETPTTLVMTGGKSQRFFADGANALVDLLPDAEHKVLEGQDHGVAPDALAPNLREFFLDDTGGTSS